MQAVLLVGGRGVRLRPYTTVYPKSLLPVGDLPILEVVVRQLRRDGFTRLVFAVGHQHEMLRLFFGSGEKWNVAISYSLEDEPLGTAGPLRRIEGLDDTFLMMNGDVLTDLSFRAFFDAHGEQDAPLTIATHAREVHIDYGTLETGDGNRVVAYHEKPTLRYEVSMGIYAVSRAVIDHIPGSGAFDFPDLVTALLESGQPVQSYPYAGYWQDIGRPEDYERAIADFERLRLL